MPNISDFDPKQITKKSEKKVANPVEIGFHGLNEELAFLKGGEILIKEIEPSRCRPWNYHNRDTAWLNTEHCSDLISSIQKHGQNEPALVREIKGDKDYDFELIYGVRRWFACSVIPGQKLLARVTDLADKTCMILMHSENAHSKDISEFERACSFAQQMKSGVFKNQTELAEAMGLTQGTISKMIRAAEILEYEWMQRLFQNKLEIPIKYAYTVSVLLRDPQYCDLIKKEVEMIMQKEVATGIYQGAANILKRLINSTRGKDKALLDSVILSSGDKPLMICRHDKEGKVCIFIENEVKTLDRAEVEAACLKILEDYVFGYSPDNR